MYKIERLKLDVKKLSQGSRQQNYQASYDHNNPSVPKPPDIEEEEKQPPPSIVNPSSIDKDFNLNSSQIRLKQFADPIGI